MVAYLDSSVVLQHVLLGEIAIEHALAYPRRVASELLEIECRRVIQGCRLTGELGDEGLADAVDRLSHVLTAVDLLDLSTDVKRRAMEAFPVVVRTLDAAHLATALLVDRPDDRVAVFSLDEGMNRCARALGLQAPLSA